VILRLLNQLSNKYLNISISCVLPSGWKEVVRTTRPAPTVFILARIRCMFGGADFFRSNGKHPWDDRHQKTPILEPKFYTIVSLGQPSRDRQGAL
jgi:hypothetical protein